jgi:hypothetical protein
VAAVHLMNSLNVPVKKSVNFCTGMVVTVTALVMINFIVIIPLVRVIVGWIM